MSNLKEMSTLAFGNTVYEVVDKQARESAKNSISNDKIAQPKGVASLDEAGKIPLEQIPDGIQADVYSDTINKLSAEIAVERARINNLTKMEEGSTTGDAELIDGRVDYNGKTWENIGSHIRGISSQFSKDNTGLVDSITKLKNDLPNTTLSYEFVQESNHYWSVENEVISKAEYTGSYLAINPIEVSLGDNFHIDITSGVSKKTRSIIIVDKDYKALWMSDIPITSEWGKREHFDLIITDPNAKYLLLTPRDTTTEISKDVFFEDSLKGCHISIIGDSISAYTGTIPDGNKPYYTGTNAGVTSSEQMWWKILCDEVGANPLVINAWSGSCVTANVRTDTTEASNISRCQALHTDENIPDIIIIAMGVNDYSYNAPLGDWNGTTAIENTSDFSQAYAYMLDNIHSAYPYAQIFCITPWFMQRGTSVGYTYINDLGFTANDYANKIKAIAPLLNARVIDGASIGFNNYNYNPNYSSDSVTKPTHPNAKGHYVMGRTVAKALKEMHVMTLSN